MPTETNAAENMFIELARQVYERLIRGEYDYEKDLETLELYIERAQRLKSPYLQARITSVIAILNSISGRVQEAITKIEEALALLGDNDNYIELRLNLLYNLGYIHLNMGDYDKAMALYEQGLAQIQDPHALLSNSYTLLTGKMSVLVYLHRYDEAEQITKSLDPIAEEFLFLDRRDYGKRVMYVYLNLSRIVLLNGELETARSHAHMSRELAEQLKMPLEIAETTLHCARIEKRKGDEEARLTYISKAEAQAGEIHMPPEAARYYLTGAQFFLEDGDMERAKNYAEKSHAAYEALKAEMGMARSQQIIDAVAAAQTVESAD